MSIGQIAGAILTWRSWKKHTIEVASLYARAGRIDRYVHDKLSEKADGTIDNIDVGNAGQMFNQISSKVRISDRDTRAIKSTGGVDIEVLRALLLSRAYGEKYKRKD